MRHPVYYKSKNHTKSAVLTILCGIVLGGIDIFVEFGVNMFTIGWVDHPGCSSSSYFTSEIYQTYWVATNLVTLPKKFNFLDFMRSRYYVYNHFLC